jgi:hypothetical protein
MVSSRPLLSSPLFRGVGVHPLTLKAYSGLTRVTAHRMAQSPQVTSVTRLQYDQLPEDIARQLPDLPPIIRVEPSSPGISRHRGALNNAG